MEATEQSWVRRLREGDPEAFDQVFAAYRPRVFSFLCRLCGRRDLAEDLVQETFLRLARHAPRLEAETRLSSWLFAVARNLLVSHRRHFRPDREVLRAEAVEPGPEWISPFDLAAASETERRLEHALAGLPEAQREAILLVGVERLDPSQAAEVVGVSAETLRQRLSRARAALARGLAEREGD